MTWGELVPGDTVDGVEVATVESIEYGLVRITYANGHVDAKGPDDTIGGNG